MALPVYSGTWGLKQAAHLLRRATFGATKDQIDSFVADYSSPVQAVNALFRPPTLPDPVLPIDPKTGVTWVWTPPTAANSKEFELQDYLIQWILGQMMSPGVPANLSLAYSAREKVVHFLHTHFTTIASKVSSSRALYFQNELFRKFALDVSFPLDPPANPADTNFKKLTVKISVDNAMLRLLDGNLNVKGSVNENYGRELIELYTIGKGLQGKPLPPPPAAQYDYGYYTEQDVQAAANVLTGWVDDDTFSNIDLDTALPRGTVRGSITDAGSHETDDALKVFSSRLGDVTITGLPLPTEASALDEIDRLIELIYQQPETTRHICWKIYRFYVASMHTLEDSLAIDSPIIDEMVNTFIAGGYKLQPVIENLLSSQHFYEANSPSPNVEKDDNFGGIIKSPIDLTIGALRFFDFKLPDMATDPAGFYTAASEILRAVNTQGMNFYNPYDVAGYDAYHQWPIYHRAWITPNSVANRYDFIRTLVSSPTPGMFSVDVYNYVLNNIPNAIAADVEQLITYLANYFLPVPVNLMYDPLLPVPNPAPSITILRMNYFKTRFLQDPDLVTASAYWTSRWNAGTEIGDMRSQLEFLFNAMLQSPEYQLA